MFSTITIVGRIGGEIKVSTSQGGKNIAKFSVAVDRKSKVQDAGTDWYNVTCFGYTADFVNNYLSKGRLVVVSGSPQINKWADKDGLKHEQVVVVADSVTSLDRPKDDGSPKPKPAQSTTDDEYDPFSEE